MNILLIAGHGAGDPGAIGNGYREADEARKVVASLAAVLKSYANVTVYPTDRNAFDDYQHGTLLTNAKFSSQDFVLEIHFNAFRSSRTDGITMGTEIYVPTACPHTSVPKAIVDGISRTGLQNRGLKRYNWSVINQAWRSKTPSALLEIAFIDDPDDMSVYKNKYTEIVNAIANAIVNGYGLKKEEETVSYEEFAAYMDRYITELAAKAPDTWSADARKYVEDSKLLNGTNKDQMKYKSFVTREELAQVLFNLSNLSEK